MKNVNYDSINHANYLELLKLKNKTNEFEKMLDKLVEERNKKNHPLNNLYFNQYNTKIFSDCCKENNLNLVKLFVDKYYNYCDIYFYYSESEDLRIQPHMENGALLLAYEYNSKDVLFYFLDQNLFPLSSEQADVVDNILPNIEQNLDDFYQKTLLNNKIIKNLNVKNKTTNKV